MIKPLPLFALLILAACNSPSPAFMDGQSTTVDSGGMTFGVWREGDEVEVIRTSTHAMPRLSIIHANATRAIERVTDCPIKDGTLVGDQSIMRAKLSCP